MTIRVQIWDWPLRLFHWLLVISVTGAYITGQLGGALTEWHGRFGSMVLGLLIFRIIWGFTGGGHARFASFFPTIDKLKAYLGGNWQGEGHNPAGALMLFALLLILGFLSVTGLYANDDIAFEGPLFNKISKELSDKLSGWHDSGVNILLALLALHISAVYFYLLIKRLNLITPMLTGNKLFPATADIAPVKKAAKASLIAAMLSAIIVAWGVWHIS